MRNVDDGDLRALRHLLPASVAQMAQVAGWDAVLRLVSRFGGANFPVGKNSTAAGRRLHERLAEEIGEEAALRLGRAYGAQRYLWLPKCDAVLRELRDRAIRRGFDRMTGEGMGAHEAAALLALEHNLTQRRVWDVLKKTDNTQLPLFGDMEDAR
ncbi:Mor transcription activator family [Kingella potus]|uniref:Mor transcription activator family n=1 Tax=Kingella potus TaxID=265175 RepID=A0A377QWQ5_9NEIS|nr:Mor transcription activator family protein [Kingella potus]STQ99834.1 Mor transcription activator family [Kingella potus]STR03418.1 Mor transcription activator family [Kingella potus]